MKPFKSKILTIFLLILLSCCKTVNQEVVKAKTITKNIPFEEVSFDKQRIVEKLFERAKLKTKKKYIFESNTSMEIEKLSKLLQQNYNGSIIKCTEEDEIDTIEILKDYYHLLDLNKDGREDLIYTGFCGGGYELGVNIYLQTKENYFKEVFNHVGLLTDFYYTDNRLEMIIFDSGCCASDIYQLFLCSIDYKSDSLTINYFIRNHYNLVLPFYSDTIKKIKNKHRIKLRYAPVVNDTWSEYEHLKGNIIGEYAPSQTLYLLKELQEEDGNWGLCLVAPPNTAKDMTSAYKLATEIGWVKLTSKDF